MPQINGTIIKERAKILREAGASELQKFLKTQVGKNVSVIVEKDGVGKSENFLDVKIAGEGEKLKAGEIFEVKVVGVEVNSLVATL